MIIDIISGARPNFVKIACLIKELKNNKFFNKFKIRVIHTGQHYNNNMSNIFFKELKIPRPDYNLNVGSGTYAFQIGSIMQKYEKIINKKIVLCIVVGDVNSTLACALIAKQNNIPVAHIEAGIRSNDLTMPEEINRILTDSISNYFFTTSVTANKNLIQLGISKKNIYFVGNTMIDTLKENLNSLKKPSFFNKFLLKEYNYILLTIHRPSNTKNLNSLRLLLENIVKFSKLNKIIFPCHPRLKKNMNVIKNISNNIIITNPLSYLEFNFLLLKCKVIITDSGGITEEATFLHKPCITLRENTERPETIEIGTNVLVGNSKNKLKKAFDELDSGLWKRGKIPAKWDGKTSKRISLILERILRN